ncbi:hypothetical protein K432DRAFT_471069 [Lepidopterella palustris CBS 459.81]|uniref:Uncharacterized protein n=1 Tax=Lepidopterella palustris CBS 459.81 TaxID=1314670 RepID=A0A8E2EF82_9PEZI|nr:hypothetical protein K432DRAFT_471069 [Lepidopterella palustris CBS 459.81]
MLSWLTARTDYGGVNSIRQKVVQQDSKGSSAVYGVSNDFRGTACCDTEACCGAYPMLQLAGSCAPPVGISCWCSGRLLGRHWACGEDNCAHQGLAESSAWLAFSKDRALCKDIDGPWWDAVQAHLHQYGDWKDATALVVSGGRCPGAVERPSSAGRVLAPSLSSPCAFPLCDRESSLRTDTRSLAGGSENG